MESASVPVLLPTPLVHQSQAVPSPGAVGQTLPLSHTNRSRPVLTTVVVNLRPQPSFQKGDVGLSSTIRILFMGGNVLREIMESRL